MSEAPRRESLFIDDMTRFAEKVISYTDGLDQAGFITDELTYDATLRNLELIGEAATGKIRDTHQLTPFARRSATPPLGALACS